MADKKIAKRIDTILKNILVVKNDVQGITLEDFKKSDLLVRGVSFSIAQIGEHMNKLHDLIGEQYPDLPWAKAVTMRNIIVHVYEHVKAEVVYDTATQDLDPLYNSLLEIKNDLKKVDC